MYMRGGCVCTRGCVHVRGCVYMRVCVHTRRGGSGSMHLQLLGSGLDVHFLPCSLYTHGPYWFQQHCIHVFQYTLVNWHAIIVR